MENEEVLGLDATQYLAEIKKVIQANTDQNASIKEIIAVSQRYGEANIFLGGTFRAVLDNGSRMTLAIKNYDGALQVVGKSINLVRDAQARLNAEFARKFDNVLPSLPGSRGGVSAGQAGAEMARLELADQKRLADAKSAAARQERRDRADSLAQFKRDKAEIDDAYARRAEKDAQITAQLKERERIARGAQRVQAEITDEAAARAASSRGRAANLGASFGAGSLGFRAGMGNLIGNEGFSGLGTVGNFAAGTGIGLAATAADAGVRAITGALREGASSAFEFNKQIGLVQTISKDSSDTTATWSKAVRDLSREFNRPEVEVAAGTYQALSNQIIKSTKDIDFMRTSLSLAKSTNSSVTESTDALSAVINSFGSAAGSATDISDKLFRSVDLGNFKLSEISTTLGRVTSMAKPLGVSFNEVLASLDTTTIKGVKADEALSALSNLYSELLKPSHELTNSMQRLGFMTAQQGIATLGYGGFLKAVIADSNKFGVSIAQLFPNIRGLREALLESNDGFDIYEKNLKGVETATGATADALKVMQKVAGEDTANALNSLKEDASEIWTILLKDSDALIKKLRELRGLREGRKPEDEFVPKQLAHQDAVDTDWARNFGRDARTGSMSFGPNQHGVPQVDFETEYARQKAGFDARVAREKNKADGVVQGNTAALRDQFKINLQAYADYVAKRNVLSKQEINQTEESAKAHQHALDTRRVASEEFVAKQRQSEGAAQLESALKLDPQNTTKLIEGRIEALRNGSFENVFGGSDLPGIQGLLGKASGLKQGDFDKEKFIEDARRQEEEILALKIRQRDAILQGVIEGKASRDDLKKAEEEVTEEKRKQYELEVQIQGILNARTAADKADSDKKVKEGLQMQAILAAQAKVDADRKSGNVNGMLLDAKQLELNVQAKALSSGAPALETNTAAWGAAKWAERKAAIDAQAASDSARWKSYQDPNMMDEYWFDKPLGYGTKGRGITSSGPGDLDAKMRRAYGAPVSGDEPAEVSEARHARIVAENEKILAEDMAALSAKRLAEAFDGAASHFRKTSDPNFPRGYATGGYVAASDTVPAMLTPGEYVINAGATRSYLPLLEAINRGQARGYAEGGQVTNVGDINVTVKGGSTSQATISEIGRGLERAIRRGTLKLRSN